MEWKGVAEKIWNSHTALIISFFWNSDTYDAVWCVEFLEHVSSYPVWLSPSLNLCWCVLSSTQIVMNEYSFLSCTFFSFFLKLILIMNHPITIPKIVFSRSVGIFNTIIFKPFEKRLWFLLRIVNGVDGTYFTLLCRACRGFGVNINAGNHNVNEGYCFAFCFCRFSF